MPNQNQSPRHRARHGLMAVGLAALAACGGGGGGGLEPVAPRTIGTVAFALPAGGAPTPLDLDDPVLILASALSTLSASVQFDSLLDDDSGAAPPGRGTLRCDSGQFTETATQSGAARTVRVDHDQCSYESTTRDEILDGPFRLESVPTVSGFEGTVDASLGGDRLRGAFRDAGASTFAFLQLDASIDFETVDNRGALRLRGARYVGGEAVFAGESPLMPRIFSEVLAGTTATELLLFVEREAGAREVAMEGPVSVRGSGLSAACALPASAFSIATNTAVRIEVGGDDDSLVAGLLTLSNPTQNAAVQFNADQSITVTPDSAPPRVFTRAELGALCGFQP